MSLKEKVAALEEITPQTVREVLTFEDFKFEILEAMNNTPDYDSLLSIFYETQVFIDGPVYNIMNEKIAFKGLYLNFGLGMDMDVVNALICVIPVIQLDFELEKIFKDDEFYKYMEETYWQHRRNTEFNFTQLTEMIQGINFEEYIKELQGSVQDLNKLAN